MKLKKWLTVLQISILGDKQTSSVKGPLENVLGFVGHIGVYHVAVIFSFFAFIFVSCFFLHLCFLLL